LKRQKKVQISSHLFFCSSHLNNQWWTKKKNPIFFFGFTKTQKKAYI